MHSAVEFPCAGVAARRWRRFEEELLEWLASAEGRFAVYCAERERPEAIEARRRPDGAHLTTP